MKNHAWCIELLFAIVVLLLAPLAGSSQAELYINEIFFDPPGSAGDISQEYIELRGAPNMPLDDHYLIFLESEGNDADSGNAGQVDFIFDLSGRSLSPTGYFSLRQRGNPYSNVTTNEFNVMNTLPGTVVGGWGTTPGVDNNVGAWSSSLYSSDPGKLENSGFTAMLIRKNAGGPVPELGMLLDGNVDNDDNPLTIHDGLDYPNGVPDLPDDGGPAWSILDSIGIFSEFGEAVYGRTYATVNFGPEVPGRSYVVLVNGVPTQVTFQPNITDGQQYSGLDYEIELISRWGNSTGETAADWHITNVTNNGNAGFVNAADGFRQSGHYHDPPIGADDFVQTNQYVPYGANLTNSIGSANYPLNVNQLPWDYNQNGVVDAADYVIWRHTFGSTTDLRADGNGGKRIEEDDWLFWAGRFGDTLASGSPAGTGSTVPEPASWLLAVVSLLASIAGYRRNR